MQDIDVQGTSSVASLIEQSGLTKFCIYKTGSGKHASPVFEYINPKATNKDARRTFIEWANNILQGGANSNAYDLLLFNDIEIKEEGEENETIQRTKKKSNKLRFSFVLSQAQERGLGVLNGAEGDPKSIGELIRLSISNALAERDKTDLVKKIESLEARLDEQEQEGDEVGDSAQDKLMQGLGALLLSKLGGGAVKPAEETLNGAPDMNTKMENINKAVKILWRHDKDLDSDLLKLSAVAEGNPAQFNFLLNALRNL